MYSKSLKARNAENSSSLESTKSTFFFESPDKPQDWDNVRDEVKSIISDTQYRDPMAMDYNFITPRIIALGKFKEFKEKWMLEILDNRPTVMWNYR